MSITLVPKNMMQVVLGANPRYKIGDPILTFTEAFDTVQLLESAWDAWVAAGRPETQDPVQHLENSDIMLICDNGAEYVLGNEDRQWHIMN